MATPRFFVDCDFELQGNIQLPEKPAHHAGIVLRMRNGDSAVLFNGRGEKAIVTLQFSHEGVVATVEAIERENLDEHLSITLIQSLVSQEKLDWILEKSTELGVDEIIIAPASRSVNKLDAKRLEKRLQQWKKTTIAACEQCARLRFPNVSWQPNLTAALQSVQAEQKIILAPAATTHVNFTTKKSVAFAVGPEGGFSDEEIQIARDLGYECLLLGPRVLRTETAGLTAIAVTQWEIGDFR